MMRDISVSDIVESLAGHDRGEIFAVVATDGEFLYLANGKQRKLQKPKRKKVIHARRAFQCSSPLAEKLVSGAATDGEIRKELAVLRDRKLTEEGKKLGKR